MRSALLFQRVRVRPSRLPRAGALVPPAQGVAQRRAAAGGPAELLRELREQALGVQVAARPADLALQHRRVREVLEERHDVGERLVECVDVRVARLVESRVDAVEEGVRHLVRDDVVRQAGEDERPRDVMDVLGRDGEISEQQRLLLRAVVGVPVPQRVWVDAQSPHELPSVLAVGGPEPPVRPERHAPERPLEVPNRGHGDRVDHLLVELRIGLRRQQAVLREQVWVVEVHRSVDHVAGGIAVHDLDVLADRPGLKRLPGYLRGDLVDRRRFQLGRQARIEGEDAQTTGGGRFDHATHYYVPPSPLRYCLP